MLMLEKVFRQGLAFNLALCPKCMDRLLSCSCLFEKIAAYHRVERPPWTAGLEIYLETRRNFILIYLRTWLLADSCLGFASIVMETFMVCSPVL